MRSFKLILLLACTLILLFGATDATIGVVHAWDDCSNAMPVGNVTDLAFDTTEATFDGPGVCMDSPNIWLRYTATCNGIATVSLCGSDYDTKLAVYDGAECPPTEGNLLRCNDDFCGSKSQVSFGVVSGNQYLIEVGGYQNKTGQGVLTITCEPAVCPPPNDSYFNAQPIGDVWQLPFDTRCATFDGPGDCMTSPNIWYRYTASCTGKVTVSLCDSDYDTMLAVYSSTLSHLIDCNDDFCGWQSQLTFNAIAGQQYLIEIGGYNDESGEGILTIICEGVPFPPPPLPPFNDDCSRAIPVNDVKDLPFDTSNATFDGPGLCMNSPNIWYCYTATCTGDVTVSLCGSSYDTKLAVYKGCDCNLTAGDLIGCNDDFCGRQSQLTFSAIAGNQYLIEIGGYANKTGQGVLSISCEGEPPVEL
ncbi:MAG: hypothetical protein ACE5NM_01410, partial [Sedimentisphaerales bacterium]